MALEALYVVAVNVFLSTSLFEKVIDATPESVDIHFARGWSIFPTRVHARQLSIRGADSHIEWILRLDQVEFDCSLLALLRKEFRVTMAHGSGITFRARFKVASPAATPELQRELPAIESLGPVGLLPSEPPYAGEWDDKRWHLWTVSIHGANAEHVREVWIEHARFTGDAHVEGGFYLKPIRSVEVGPITLDVRTGSVDINSRVAADHLVARVDVAIRQFDPRTVGAILRLVSLSTDASLVLPNLESLGVLHGDGQELSGEVDVPKLVLRVASGVLRDGSLLHASGPHVNARAGRREVSGALAVSAEVDHDRLVARVVGEQIMSSVWVEVPLLTASFDSAELALDSPFGDLHAVVDVRDAQVADASRLDELLPTGFAVRVLGGSLHGSAHGEAWRREARVAGRFHVRGETLDLASKELRVRGDAMVDASVDSLHLDTLVASGFRATVLIPDASLARTAAATEPFVHVIGLRAQGEAKDLDVARPLRSFVADLEIPDLELFDRDSVRAALGFAPGLRLTSRRARLGGSAHVGVEEAQVNASLETHARDLHLTYAGRQPGPSVALMADSVSFEGHLTGQWTKRVVRGAASIVVRGFDVMGTKLHVGADARATVKIARADLNKAIVGGQAEVDLERVRGTFAPNAASPDFVAEAMTLRASTTRFDVAHPALLGVDCELDLEAAELVDARALNLLLPSSQILAIESGHAYASLRASHDSMGNRGLVEVRLAQGGLVLGDTHLAGDFELAVRAGGPGSTQDAAVVDLEGSHLAMRHVRVTGASTDTSDWAGDVMVESGRLLLGAPPKLEADVTLRARDANPILGLLFRDTLSPLIAGWTRMPSFTAVTHIMLEPHELVVSDLLASGGNLSLRGTLALRPASAGGPDGAFVVHKGPWSVGFNLDSRGAHLRLFGLDGWYQARAYEVTQPRPAPLAMP